MQKIPTLFLRGDLAENRRYVTEQVNPDAEWVIDGEGVATRKYDGTCVMKNEVGGWWARREVKKGKSAPESFVEVEHDELTGKTVGWEPAEQSGFFKYLQEAWGESPDLITPGTFELCGPKINGNPEGYSCHVLIRHATAVAYPEAPRTYDALREFLRDFDGEGLVWHHPDGRMAKIKRRDFPKEGSR